MINKKYFSYINYFYGFVSFAIELVSCFVQRAPFFFLEHLDDCFMIFSLVGSCSASFSIIIQFNFLFKVPKFLIAQDSKTTYTFGFGVFGVDGCCDASFVIRLFGILSLSKTNLRPPFVVFMTLFVDLLFTYLTQVWILHRVTCQLIWSYRHVWRLKNRLVLLPFDLSMLELLPSDCAI